MFESEKVEPNYSSSFGTMGSNLANLFKNEKRTKKQNSPEEVGTKILG